MSVTFRGSRAELFALIQSLPAMLAGTGADPQRAALGVQLRMGVALLSQVQQDFLIKSRGGTGRDGIAWPPLKPETIARRRPQSKGSGPRPSLSKAEDARWRAIYRQRLGRLMAAGLDEGEAEGEAARYAWAVLKSQGATTQVQKLGSRRVDMLRDTGALLRSLAAGIDDRPSGAPGQIFRTPPGQVIVGTNVKPWHHAGTSRLPARPLWPLDGTIPPAWWPAIRDAAARGVAEAVRQTVAGGAK